MIKPIIEMRGISKNFGAIQALENVDLELMPHEVLGLVGDNAAGKTTLMKILCGRYIPSSGRIYMEGKKLDIFSPFDARKVGIETVYQDLALADNLDVTANIFLGKESLRGGLNQYFKVMDVKRMREKARRIIEKLELEELDITRKVRNLSGGQRQVVAIARAISFNPKVLIMDEPTASLAISKVSRVLELVKRFRKENILVIYIGHRLQEIFQIADRVMILRRGKNIGTYKTSEISMDEVIKLIIGEH